MLSRKGCGPPMLSHQQPVPIAQASEMASGSLAGAEEEPPRTTTSIKFWQPLAVPEVPIPITVSGVPALRQMRDGISSTTFLRQTLCLNSVALGLSVRTSRESIAFGSAGGRCSQQTCHHCGCCRERRNSCRASTNLHGDAPLQLQDSWSWSLAKRSASGNDCGPTMFSHRRPAVLTHSHLGRGDSSLKTPRCAQAGVGLGQASENLASPLNALASVVLTTPCPDQQ